MHTSISLAAAAAPEAPPEQNKHFNPLCRPCSFSTRLHVSQQSPALWTVTVPLIFKASSKQIPLSWTTVWWTWEGLQSDEHCPHSSAGGWRCRGWAQHWAPWASGSASPAQHQPRPSCGGTTAPLLSQGTSGSTAGAATGFWQRCWWPFVSRAHRLVTTAQPLLTAMAPKCFPRCLLHLAETLCFHNTHH